MNASDPDPSWLHPYVAENRALIAELRAEHHSILDRVHEIEATIHWLTRLIIGAIASGVIAYVAARYH
jgi:hypothetical protein